MLPQLKQKEKEIRLLILGLDNAGKTTIVRRLCGKPIDTIEPTLGFDIVTLTHSNYNLNLWDVGGQSSIRSYWRNYFETSVDGLIWVVDSTDTMRLQQCRQHLEQLLQEEKLAGATLLVFANKQDMASALSADEIVQTLKLQESAYAKKRHWNIVACSAVSGDGLVDGIDWMVEDVASRIYLLA